MRESDAAVIIDGLTRELIKSVANGNRIEIRGFGRFIPRTRAAKQGINPRTGAAMKIDAGRTILFRPSNELVKKMN
jgi:nucleoid DNA-binding protein